jgi:DNA invertase Pin-like site-specific DNA recombinase
MEAEKRLALRQPSTTGLAEIELEYRQERQAAGIEVAKRKGIYKGRRKGTTKAEPSRASQLRAKGLTVAEIATALGTNKRTVQRYLKAATDKVVARSEIGKLR